MQQEQERFDVIVVGGGPGGSTAAALIAEQGHKVLLLEREHFPRYHIGESLLPGTVHSICALLGLTEEIHAAGFVKKMGGTFRWGSRPEPWTFLFSETKLASGQRPPYAFQVERSKFDDILLRNAGRKGADVREGCSVREVLFEGERAVGVRYAGEGRPESTALARFVVDASGQSGLLANRIGQRVYDRFFRNLAVWGYFQGGKRFPEEGRRGNVISAAFEEGWIWYIPLSDQLTSVGAVVPVEQAGHIKELGQEAALYGYIDACPLIKDFLSPATRVTDGQYGAIRILRDFSYLATRFWTPGAVLVGDAACFIDPVFSSGVHLATYSGLLAARSINTVLRGELDEPLCFTEYERRYRREYGVFYEFLMAFYDMHQERDSYFWTARKVLNAQKEAREAFVQLVAGLSNEREPLFLDADAFLASARRRTGMLEALSEASVTGDLPDEAREEAVRFGRIFFRERAQLWQAQERARRGEPLSDLLETPIFEDGLIASTDGLRWQRPTPLVPPPG
jgi:FAD-dependent halogenase